MVATRWQWDFRGEVLSAGERLVNQFLLGGDLPKFRGIGWPAPPTDGPGGDSLRWWLPGSNSPDMTPVAARVAKASAIFGSLAVLATGYWRWVRPWQLTWGATDGEVARALPGDEVVKSPSFNATRAVSIAAPPACIYPWLVQMGVGRAGWYSYDVLDNLARPSATVILPEHQQIEVGDVVPMSPDGRQGMRVLDFTPNCWLLWWDGLGDSTWAWSIQPGEGSSSRLVSRVRMRYRWTSVSILFGLLVEFFDLIMMRRAMLGIAQRAEALASARAQSL